MRAVLAIALLQLGACASASKDNPVDGNGFVGGHIDAPVGTQHDAPIGQQIDAPMQQIDAPAGGGEVTLTQTSDTAVNVGSSVTCGNNAAGYTGENTWYRTFAPPGGQFHVEHVDFGVQEAGGTQSVQINIGTYSGTLGSATLNTAMITPIGTATVNVPGTSTGELLTTSTFSPASIDIAAGKNIVVSIYTPDHTGTTTYFYVGASAGGQTAEGYILAATCGVTTPEKLTTAAAGAGSLILSVTGTH